jgi:hypothetical protein
LAPTFGWLMTATVPATGPTAPQVAGRPDPLRCPGPLLEPHTDIVMPILPGLAEAADGQQPTETRTNKVTEDV